MKTINLSLNVDDVELLGEALDSHMYWQISDERERKDGFVFYPEPGSSEYESATEDERERWAELKRIETLIERLKRCMFENKERDANGPA